MKNHLLGRLAQGLLSNQESNKDCRLRYKGWDHKILYFTPHYYDEESGIIEGKLNNGEEASFNADSDFWEIYHEGMEEEARAV